MADWRRLVAPERNTVLAGSVTVTRADELVALVIDIQQADLHKLEKGEPLTVLACFEAPADARRVRRALSKAADDAAAAIQRKRGAG